MTSMMKTLQIRKQTSLPVSSLNNEPGLLRRRLSSLSLNLSNQPASIASRFPRSNSVKEWWEWTRSWILSTKPIFIRDLELNKDEAKSIGAQNRGSIMHFFVKLRTQFRNLMDPSSDSLPKYKRQR